MGFANAAINLEWEMAACILLAVVSVAISRSGASEHWVYLRRRGGGAVMARPFEACGMPPTHLG